MHPSCCRPVAWMRGPAYVVGVKDVAIRHTGSVAAC